jgi:ATP-dependent helicase YprA (DUF1998 family)
MFYLFGDRSKELLLKGPFVEALPDFIKGESLEALTQSESPLLHPAFSRLSATEFERPLHSHQHDALEAIIGCQQNVVVATGTGSGKTECVLYPILDSLLKEPRPRPDGVRALLVYPLNALANDQLYKRLVPLFVHRFQDQGLTVGRYTGLTRQGLTRAGDPEFGPVLPRDARVGPHPYQLAPHPRGNASDSTAHSRHELCDARAPPFVSKERAALPGADAPVPRPRRSPHLFRRAGH